LLIVRQGGIEDQLNSLVPQVLAAISHEDAALKSEALGVLHLILDYHSPKALANLADKISNAVLAAVKTDYAKIKSEGLRVLASNLKAVTKESKGFESIISNTYTTVYAQMLNKDVDQEVKESSMYTMSSLLASFGDLLKDKLSTVLPVLVDRLGNELTRIPALRATTKVANSPLKLDLSSIASQSVTVLSAFLRKESQTLKHETAICLEALIRAAGKSALTSETSATLLKEIPPHITDTDLVLSRLILELASTAIAVDASLADNVWKALVSKILEFLKSPLLQGPALGSVVKFFQHLLNVCLFFPFAVFFFQSLSSHLHISLSAGQVL
jgi:cullin-associated NEDD8-dissociated protein 1